MSDIDIVIKGGTVVDGTGAERRDADVAISGDRIVAVEPGLAETNGARVLDATGCVVAPGLVDVHTHYDAQVFWDPALTPSCHHGITSVVMGNCGYSISPISPEHVEQMIGTMEQVEDMDPACLQQGVPWEEIPTFADYRAAIERRGTVLNVTAYIGHTAVRVAAMGTESFEREATDDEVAEMCRLVDESLAAGAIGFATSFSPTHNGWAGHVVPSRKAAKSEVETLCKRVGAFGRGMIEVAMGEQYNVFDGIYELQRSSGAPLSYGALIAMEGLTGEFLRIHAEETAKGADVWPQCTPRPITLQFTMRSPFSLTQAPALSALIGMGDEDRRARYADEDFRASLKEQLPNLMVKVPFEKMTVDETTTHAALVGRSITDIAAELDRHPVDVLLDMAVEDLDTRYHAVLANDHTPDVYDILPAEHMALSFSDAGAHVGMLCDAQMQTDVLSRWVRDEGVLTLETAIHKMSGQLAGAWQLTDRGELREGAFADVYVFDPDTIDPGPTRRVYDFPADSTRLVADEPTGIRHVLVNGTPITVEGDCLATTMTERPGRWLAPGV